MSIQNATRREFIKSTASLGIGLWAPGGVKATAGNSPNEKLNLGIIGAGGRGAANLYGVRSENIVAICDVDERPAAESFEQHPRATRYSDWRKLLDNREIDAVVVSTTDHTHALISLNAILAGKHVYCEKPIGLSVQEARLLHDTSLKTKVATQQGTQVHITQNFHHVAGMIKKGAIGPVREAHVWCTRHGGGWARPKRNLGGFRSTLEPTGKHPVPDYLDWNLWLGPAPDRPYHPDYFPGCAKWNKYWDFGGGVLGDMGSHLIDFPYAALNLTWPTAIEAEGEPINDETTPAWMRVRWDHPATADRPAVKVYWYDGIKSPQAPKPVNTNDWHGILYVGDKGMLWANYGGYALLPAEDPDNCTPPEPNVPPLAEMQGHHDEWIAACKTGAPTACNFRYAGRLIEHNMLGLVALRTGKKITWDAKNMKVVDCPEAEQYINRTYRKGWELPA